MVQRWRITCQMASTIWSMLLTIWQSYPMGFLCMIFLQILQGLSPIAMAWITKVLFDTLAHTIAEHKTNAVAATLPTMIIFLLVCLAIFTILTQFAALLDQYLNGELGRRLSLTIQERIYKKVAGFTGLAYFEDPALHNTIQLSVSGASAGPLQLLRSLMTIIRSGITLFSFLGVLLIFNLWMTIIVLIAVLPGFFVQWRLGKQRFNVTSGNSPKERLANYYGQVMAGVPFAKEVRLFNLVGYFLHAFMRTTQTIMATQRRQQQRELLWEGACTILSAVVGSGALIFVFVQAFHGLLSFGDVSLYLSAVGNVQATLLGIVFASTQINVQILFFRQYIQLLAMPQPLPLSLTPRAVPILSEAIELRDVSFRYSEQHPWVLRHVNLRISVGKCLALVGLNGAGKTTLVKLLARLYDPTEGEVLWDGIDIREFDPQELRQHIAAIFQDFAHYDLSVQENIGLGDVGHIDDTIAIERAAKLAGTSELIDGLPEGYATVLSRWLGERKAGPGVDLSGGQWQKIALARMFMRDAEMLMLDEPTAALDAQSEYDLHQRFAALMQGRTNLIITHRFSTVRMADEIVVLEDGQITEHGTHCDLLISDKTYARLYRMQAEYYQPIY